MTDTTDTTGNIAADAAAAATDAVKTDVENDAKSAVSQVSGYVDTAYHLSVLADIAHKLESFGVDVKDFVEDIVAKAKEHLAKL